MKIGLVGKLGEGLYGQVFQIVDDNVIELLK
jgi:hypothetical protein